MRRLTCVALVTIAAASVCSPQAAVTAVPDVTFTRDVAPILHAKCVACHRAGEVAPMALLTYQDARPWARAIKDNLVDLVLPNQTIPSVLHIPRSGEGAWYVPTFGMITVAPITDIQWAGGSYTFTASLRVGRGAAPFAVTGRVQDDGSIRASVEPIANGRIPFKEFTGSPK
jgi:hypothetical protein